tara:strand:- start:2279 stop:2488 length:210 start_codon:yes stop_codon:yes gene_type:complete
MKSALNVYLFLFVLFTFGEKSFSLSDYQIKKICRKERRERTCIKNLLDKRFKLQNGDIVEIPVIPYEGN